MFFAGPKSATTAVFLAINSGSGSESKVTPKVAVAYLVNDFVELYANWGKGFHTNDVRGATIRVDPQSGDGVLPVEVFADQQGAEVGVRLEGWQGLFGAEPVLEHQCTVDRGSDRQLGGQ